MREGRNPAAGASFDHRCEEIREASRLERSVADTLRVIAAACAEREAPPIHAARQHLREIYGAARLRKQREQVRRSA
jgi:hypothetical protein